MTRRAPGPLVNHRDMDISKYLEMKIQKAGWLVLKVVTESKKRMR